MISPAEMRVLDRNAQYFGVSILELMENAGKAVADAARSEFGAAGKNVLVLGGTGNNGGDCPLAPPPPPEGAPGTGLPPRSPHPIAPPGAAADFEPTGDGPIPAGLGQN